LKPQNIPTHEVKHASMHIEALRDAVLAHKASGRTDLMMLGFGNLAQIKPRLDFSLGLLSVASFDIINPNVFDSVETAIHEVASAKPQAVCLCALDEAYPELVPALCKGLKALPQAPVIILAGYPADKVESYRAEGVDIFIHLRANAFDTLKDIAIRMGVKA
ncbi:MAG: hypothetical protein U1B83_07675, partial [Candidatus Cloacimonadaceae bacterium]|nr:hypothetical protein [Candidatus Cloacimonadaceae bacterium]